MVKKILGNGSTYQKKSGERYFWCCEVNYLDENSKRRKKCFSGGTKKEAKKKGDEFIVAFKTSDTIYSNKTLNEVFEEMITMKKDVFRRKDSTLITQRRTYDNNVRGALGDTKMADLTTQAIQHLVNTVCKKSSSDSVPQKVKGVISECWNFYLKKDNLDIDIVSLVKVNKEKSNNENKFYTKKECEKIYNAAKELAARKSTQSGNLAYAVNLMLYTGIRIGELQGLTWDNIDFENRTLTVEKIANESHFDEYGERTTVPVIQHSTKTKSGVRVVPLSSRAIEALVELKKRFGHTPYVVASLNNGIVRRSKIANSFHEVLSYTDIDYSGRSNPHILRHTFSTNKCNDNIDINYLSVIAGHSDPRTTKRLYVHDNEKRAMNELESSKFFM